MIERLADRYRLKVYFYNPNITDPGEYERRLKAQRQVIEKFNRGRSAEDVVTLFEGTYDPKRFLKAVQGLEEEPENGSAAAMFASVCGWRRRPGLLSDRDLMNSRRHFPSARTKYRPD